VSSPEPSAEGASARAPPALGPKQLLRIRAIWVMPLVISGILVFLMTLFYVGWSQGILPPEVPPSSAATPSEGIWRARASRQALAWA
jgi:hypothetical protein